MSKQWGQFRFLPNILKQVPYFCIIYAGGAKEKVGVIPQCIIFRHPITKIGHRTGSTKFPLDDWLKFTNAITPSCVNIDVYISFPPTRDVDSYIEYNTQGQAQPATAKFTSKYPNNVHKFRFGFIPK